MNFTLDVEAENDLQMHIILRLLASQVLTVTEKNGQWPINKWDNIWEIYYPHLSWLNMVYSSLRCLRPALLNSSSKSEKTSNIWINSWPFSILLWKVLSSKGIYIKLLTVPRHSTEGRYYWMGWLSTDMCSIWWLRTVNRKCYPKVNLC